MRTSRGWARGDKGRGVAQFGVASRKGRNSRSTTLRSPVGMTGCGHPLPHTNSVREPHVRNSVRGLIETGRSPIKALSFLFSVNNKARVPHISLVFSEMWDTTALPQKPFPRRSCSIPPFAKKREAWATRALVVTEGVSYQRAAWSSSTPRVSTGNSGERSGAAVSLPARQAKQRFDPVAEEGED